MPVYADQLTRGRGKFAARLVVEGWPYIFCTDARLERTLADGRQQIRGLLGESIRIAARLDMIRGELREQEMSAELADIRSADARQLLTHALYRTPTATTFLTESVSEHDTTLYVSSVDGFGTEVCVFHMGTEAILGLPMTSPPRFIGCNRGVWDTIAQAHSIGSGGDLRYPKITDLPTILRDRRVRLYLYGSGDDGAGDGTLRWRGVCRTDLDYEPPMWRFGIEPLSRVLEQTVGGDLDEPVPIRGVYLPSDEALVATLTLHSGAGYASATTSDEETIALSGFWDDNYALADDLQTEIGTATAAWSWESGAELRAESLGTGGYRFVYRTGPTTAHYLTIGGPRQTGSDEVTVLREGISPVDYFVSMLGNGGQWRDDTGAAVETLEAARTYTMNISAMVPRTFFGDSGGYSALFRHVGADPYYPPRRLYLGGLVTPSAEMAVKIEGRDEDDDDRFAETIAVDVPDRWIQVAGGGSSPMGAGHAVRLVRLIARGHVGDLIDTLIADSPAQADTNGIPLLSPDDWDTDWTELEDAIAGVGVGADRVYPVSEGTSLGQIIAEELKLVGCHLSLNATGQLAIRRLGIVTPTAREAVTLDARKTKGGRPRLTRSPDGHLREVLVRQGWDPIEGEHRGVTIRNRHTTGSRRGGVLEIAPRSKTGGVMFSESDPLEVTVEQARLLSQSVLAMYGEAYTVYSLELGLELFDLALGEVGLLSSSLLPAANGTLGVQALPAKVIGYDWSLFEGKGSIDLMAHDRRVAGYAPAATVVSWVDLGSNLWSLQLSLTNYSDGTASDWFSNGDKIRITQRDTLRPVSVTGTIVDISLELVQLDGVWVPGLDEWRFGYDKAPTVNTTPATGRRWAQSDFAFVAGSTRRIEFSTGSADPYEFSP